MKTMFVKLLRKPLTLQDHVSATEWCTMSVPVDVADDIFEVPDDEFFRGKISEKLLQEVSKPSDGKFHKLGKDVGDFVYVMNDKDEKLRLDSEKAERTKERMKVKETAKETPAKR